MIDRLRAWRGDADLFRFTTTELRDLHDALMSATGERRLRVGQDEVVDRNELDRAVRSLQDWLCARSPVFPHSLRLTTACICLSLGYILGVVSKRLVDIDDDLLAQARQAAGTSTIKATVEAGLRRLVDDDMTERHVGRLRRGGLDLGRAEEARMPLLVEGG